MAVRDGLVDWSWERRRAEWRRSDMVGSVGKLYEKWWTPGGSQGEQQQRKEFPEIRVL